ncbi:MAG: type II secretion system protein N [Rhizobacter sp.]
MARKPIRRGLRRRFASSAVPTHWQESSYAEMAWEQSRSAASRWAMTGALLGLLIGIIVFAPATWLADAVSSATGQRVQLADARGSIWSGSAVAVLTGGPESRDASALPGRVEWSLGFKGLGFDLRVRHACCLNDTVSLLLKPGLGRVSAALAPKPDWVGQWPAAFLSGYGTPWNTLQLGGSLRLLSSGLKLDWVQGRWIVDGQADIDILQVSSRASTLDPLGSYRFSINGTAGGPPQLRLSTLSGSLQLTGEGTAGANGVRFKGEARAATEADEAPLNNLLNIIGRRNGAVSVISIG